MTDNEIMKALECCAQLDDDNRSICETQCPYKAECYDKEKNVNFLVDLMNLIKHQKAEIEGLKKHQKAENERLERLAELRRKDVDNLSDELIKSDDKVKRLKKENKSLTAENATLREIIEGI